jgi:hypothetical protein
MKKMYSIMLADCYLIYAKIQVEKEKEKEKNKANSLINLIAVSLICAISLLNYAEANNLTSVGSEQNTDYVSVGVGGLRNFGYGTLGLSGVSGDVQKAILYWHGPTNSTDINANANIIFSGYPIFGENIGMSDDNCWGYENSQAYKADVTPYISGNGIYSISGLVQDHANANGASLLVFYDDGDDSNNKDIFLFEGNDSNIPNSYDAPGWNIVLSPINYGGGIAQLEMHVADGQSFMDDTITVNEQTIAESGPIFQGTSVPSDNSGPTGNGSLWDIRQFDIGSLLRKGLNRLEMRSGVASDCLGAVVIAVDVPTGSVVSQPGQREFTGELNPNYPTIVLTHGLQPDEGVKGYEDDVEGLWSGSDLRQAGKLIEEYFGVGASNYNIIQYIWGEAFQDYSQGLDILPDKPAYISAQENVIDAGVRLAKELVNYLDKPEAPYKERIHFIGHSLGVAVNAYAAREFFKIYDDPNTYYLAKFTSLDRPDNIGGRGWNGIPGMSADDENKYNYDSDFIGNILPINRPDLYLGIDNYYSKEGAGVGEVANGITVYNHIELVNPNDLNSIFDEGIVGNNHSGVQQWYRWSMNPNGIDDETYCDESNEPVLPENFDDSLNPCQLGWIYSFFSPRPNGGHLGTTNAIIAELTELEAYGCDSTTNGNVVTISCVEQSSPFIVFEMVVPEDAKYLSFEYKFDNIGDGDYAAVLLDDVVIWKVAGQSIIKEGSYQESGPITVGDLTGPRSLSVVLYGVGEKNAMFKLRELKYIVESKAKVVSVDIKPGSADNPINIKSNGYIPVAILGGNGFDATLIDKATVKFGPNHAMGLLYKGKHIEDIDSDGDLDMVLHFRRSDTGILCGHRFANITGQTLGGDSFEGSDILKTVGCTRP